MLILYKYSIKKSDFQVRSPNSTKGGVRFKLFWYTNFALKNELTYSCCLRTYLTLVLNHAELSFPTVIGSLSKLFLDGFSL